MKGLGTNSPSLTVILSFVISTLTAVTCLAGGSGVSINDDDKLSVWAADSPLSEVMAKLSDASAVEVKVAEEVDRPVSLSISNRNLQAVLEQIAREQELNMIIGWKQSDTGPAISSVMFLPANDSDSLPEMAVGKTEDWERKARRQFNKDKSRAEREKRKLERAARRNERK